MRASGRRGRSGRSRWNRAKMALSAESHENDRTGFDETGVSVGPKVTGAGEGAGADGRRCSPRDRGRGAVVPEGVWRWGEKEDGEGFLGYRAE